MPTLPYLEVYALVHYTMLTFYVCFSIAGNPFSASVVGNFTSGIMPSDDGQYLCNTTDPETGSTISQSITFNVNGKYVHSCVVVSVTDSVTLYKCSYCVTLLFCI